MPLDVLDASPRTPDAPRAPELPLERSRLADMSSAARHLLGAAVMYAALSLPESWTRAEEPKATPDTPVAAHKLTTAPRLSETAIKAEAALPGIVTKLNDPKWLTREEGQRDLQESLVRIMTEMNPVPPATLKIFQDIYPKAKRGELTMEQVSRLRRGEQRYEQTAYEMPNALPPGIYDAHECLDAVRRQSGFEITIAPELQERLHGQKLDVEAWNNSTSSSIKQLCDVVDGTLEFDETNRKILRIVPKNKEDESVILTAGKAIGVVRKRNDGIAGKAIDIRMTPSGGTIVALNKVESDIDGELGIGASFIPVSGAGLPAKMTMSATGKRNQITVDATVAKFPAERRYRIDEAKTHPLGFQALGFKKFEENGTWTVVIEIGMFADIPWPPTPYAWDKLTYAVTSASEYVLRDPKGETIPATLHFVSINQREMKLELRGASAEPENIDVKAYKEFDQSAPIVFEVPHEKAKKE